jgi:uncharacterized cupin superfamily protein
MNNAQSQTKVIQAGMNESQTAGVIGNFLEVIDAKAITLNPCPIRAAWILEGNPVARNKVLSHSQDGTANTLIWDCTAGKFNWFYSIDETVYVLEGSVRLKDANGSRLVTAGDSVFFPAGSSAEWTVETYIRKVAFLRQPLSPSYLKLRAFVRRTKQLLKGGGKAAPAVTDMFG